MKPMKFGFVQQFIGLFSILFLIVFLSACGSDPAASTVTVQSTATTVVTPTQQPTTAPTATMQATAASSTIPAGFTQFKGDGFTLAYPSNWTHQKSGNYDEFVRSDGVTMFEVSLHSTDKTPCAIEPICNQGDVDGRTHAASVTVNGITWQQSDWWYYLSSEYYIERQLTYANPQTKRVTTIVYGDYSQVASTKLINFDQANSAYFQPILQSFRLQ